MLLSPLSSSTEVRELLKEVLTNFPEKYDSIEFYDSISGLTRTVKNKNEAKKAKGKANEKANEKAKPKAEPK